MEKILFPLWDEVKRLPAGEIWAKRTVIATKLQQILDLVLPHFEHEEERLGDEFIQQHFSQKEANGFAWKVVIFAQLRSLAFPSVGYFFFSQSDEVVNEIFSRFPGSVVWFLKHILLPVAKTGYGTQVPYYFNFWLK